LFRPSSGVKKERRKKEFLLFYYYFIYLTIARQIKMLFGGHFLIELADSSVGACCRL
jgi:hypothetical protein